MIQSSYTQANAGVISNPISFRLFQFSNCYCAWIRVDIVKIRWKINYKYRFTITYYNVESEYALKHSYNLIQLKMKFP